MEVGKIRRVPTGWQQDQGEVFQVQNTTCTVESNEDINNSQGQGKEKANCKRAWKQHNTKQNASPSKTRERSNDARLTGTIERRTRQPGGIACPTVFPKPQEKILLLEAQKECQKEKRRKGESNKSECPTRVCIMRMGVCLLSTIIHTVAVNLQHVAPVPIALWARRKQATKTKQKTRIAEKDINLL
mmetsp:Transcript_33860/g.78108  ORF Transcript_33860/g.78108 Transcript_33860/m.78108 type:complete len:187 (-) Transcript_33860:12-572(-)